MVIKLRLVKQTLPYNGERVSLWFRQLDRCWRCFRWRFRRAVSCRRRPSRARLVRTQCVVRVSVWSDMRASARPRCTARSGRWRRCRWRRPSAAASTWRSRRTRTVWWRSAASSPSSRTSAVSAPGTGAGAASPTTSSSSGSTPTTKSERFVRATSGWACRTRICTKLTPTCTCCHVETSTRKGSSGALDHTYSAFWVLGN